MIVSAVGRWEIHTGDEITRARTHYHDPYQYVRYIFQTLSRVSESSSPSLQIHPTLQQTRSLIVHNIHSRSLSERVIYNVSLEEFFKSDFGKRWIIHAYLECNRDLRTFRCNTMYETFKNPLEIKKYYGLSPSEIKAFLIKFISHKTLENSSPKNKNGRWIDNISQTISETFGYLVDIRFLYIRLIARDSDIKIIRSQNFNIARKSIHDKNDLYNVVNIFLLSYEKFKQLLRKSRNTYPGNGKNIEIIDVDISMMCSIIESLKFDQKSSAQKDHGIPLYGNIDLQSFDDIRDKFLRIRKNRHSLIEAARRGMVNYSLYKQGEEGRFEFIAAIRNRHFIGCIEQFKEYLYVPSVEEIEKIGNCKIKDFTGYLYNAIPKDILLGLKQFSVRKALEFKVKEKESIELVDLHTSETLSPFYRSGFEIKKPFLAWFQKPKWKASSKGVEKGVFDYIEGTEDLNNLGMTEQTASQFLRVCKVIDRSFVKDLAVCPNSTVPIRQEILKLCSPNITTCEVFTKTLYPTNFNNFTYLNCTRHWMDERVVFQAQLIVQHNLLAKFLSLRLTPRLFATRGNTGVGKSFWIHRIVKDYLEENHQLVNGVLNPDLIKAILKRSASKPLSNQQVYAEGRVMFESFLATLEKKLSGVNGGIVDSRLLTLEEFDSLLTMSRLRKTDLEIVDIEGSILSSIISVLHRDPLSKDPCVSFDVIKDGFCRARQYRQAFIDKCRKENVHYSLYQGNEKGEFTLVAEQRDNQFIYDETSLEECLRKPSENEIDAIGQILISQEWIDSLPYKGKHILQNWIGISLYEALKQHS